jgi:hypothetical protein
LTSFDLAKNNYTVTIQKDTFFNLGYGFENQISLNLNESYRTEVIHLTQKKLLIPAWISMVLILLVISIVLLTMYIILLFKGRRKSAHKTNIKIYPKK